MIDSDMDTLCESIGIDWGSVGFKVNEVIRKMNAKFPENTNAFSDIHLIKHFVALDIACQALSLPFNRKALIKMTQRKDSEYLRKVNMLKSVLQISIDKLPTIDMLCIKFGTTFKPAVYDCLNKYVESSIAQYPHRRDVTESAESATFHAAAFYLTMKRNKVPVDRDKLVMAALVDRASFNRACQAITTSQAQRSTNVVGTYSQTCKEPNTLDAPKQDLIAAAPPVCTGIVAMDLTQYLKFNLVTTSSRSPACSSPLQSPEPLRATSTSTRPSAREQAQVRIHSEAAGTAKANKYLQPTSQAVTACMNAGTHKESSVHSASSSRRSFPMAPNMATTITRLSVTNRSTTNSQNITQSVTCGDKHSRLDTHVRSEPPIVREPHSPPFMPSYNDNPATQSEEAHGPTINEARFPGIHVHTPQEVEVKDPWVRAPQHDTRLDTSPAGLAKRRQRDEYLRLKTEFLKRHKDSRWEEENISKMV